MTNRNPAQGYEIGIFNQLVKNSEAVALTQFKVDELGKQVINIDSRLQNVETKLTDIDNRLNRIEEIGEKILGSIKYIIGSIALGILINILSLPALNLFN